MEQAKTNLGNKMLHKNKSVMIEGGMIPRAKVMNQLMIDQYLMHGTLTLNQHRAAEFLLGEAVKMGAWPTGANLSGTGSRDGKHDYALTRGFGLGNTLDGVEARYGWFHRYLVLEVVIHEWDVSMHEMRMKVLGEALDHICDHRMGGTSEPWKRLKRVAANA